MGATLTTEFITLSQHILTKVEKKLSLWLREILESREHSRKYLNTFAVKQNARRIKDPAIVSEYDGLNSSYKILEHNLSSGARHEMLTPLVHRPGNEGSSRKVESRRVMTQIVTEGGAGSSPRDNPLVNKEFYCVQYGNEGNLSANAATQGQRTVSGRTRC